MIREKVQSNTGSITSLQVNNLPPTSKLGRCLAAFESQLQLQLGFIAIVNYTVLATK